MRFPRLANLFAVVLVASCAASAAPPGSGQPAFDLDLAGELCDLRSQQPNNDPPAGVDFLSENELVVYTVCHTQGRLAERGAPRESDPNHLKAVIVDLPTGTIKRRFDWLTRGRGSLLRVTHSAQLLLKLDNVLQILKPDKTPIVGLTIPKVSPTDLVWATLSPAVDALSVTLSSSAPDNKTVNGVAILDSRNLQPISRWHEDGDWWNLAASAKSVVRTVADGTRLEFRGLESAEPAPPWTSAWSGPRLPSHPLFVSDSAFAFPSEDSVLLFDEREKKFAQVRCRQFADSSISAVSPLSEVHAERIAVYGTETSWEPSACKPHPG